MATVARAVGVVCGVCGEGATYRTHAGAPRCRGHWDDQADRSFAEPIVLAPAAGTSAGAAFCRRMIAWAIERRRESAYPHERAYWEAQRAWWHARLASS